jgi:hypothetical protein
MEKTMVAKRTINAPDWVGEKELLSLLLSHAATKYEYFASRKQAYATQYGSDFAAFKKRIDDAKEESFTAWDDLIAWEAFDVAAQEWKARYEELEACLTS